MNGPKLLESFLSRNAISQVKAAQELGVSAPAIHEWLSGHQRPRPHYREAIAKWTHDEVPADAWLSPTERAAVREIEPFRPNAKKPTRGAA